jgi:hypothetical protein
VVLLFLGFQQQKKQSQRGKTLDLDYIISYEVSVLGEVLYNFLMAILKIRPDIKFYHFRSLQPIEAS